MADLEKQKAADVLKAKMHQKSVERAYDNGVKDMRTAPGRQNR